MRLCLTILGILVIVLILEVTYATSGGSIPITRCDVEKPRYYNYIVSPKRRIGKSLVPALYQY